MARVRRSFTPAEKVAVLRKHLLEAAPVSKICEEAGIAPNLFYLWQKQFFEQGAAAFDAPRSRTRAEDEKDRRIAFLEEKLQRKEHVLSELLEEHVQLKKELGEP